MNDPYILAVGSGPSDLSSMVIVFRKKTITAEIGQTVINGVGVLIAAYHVYRWEFNSEIKEVLNFLQEKLFDFPVPAGFKPSTQYNNLFRAITCCQSKLPQHEEQEEDLDLTQPCLCEFD